MFESIKSIPEPSKVNATKDWICAGWDTNRRSGQAANPEIQSGYHPICASPTNNQRDEADEDGDAAE